MPPYPKRLHMVIELQNILSFIKDKYPSDEIILIGEFNMANIKWKYDSDIIGFLLPIELGLHTYENKFLQVCKFNCLFQLNSCHNNFSI